MIVPIMLAWLEADSLASRPALAPETTAVGLRQPLPRWALGDSVFVLPEVRVPGERPKSESRRRAPTGFVTDLVPAKHTRALATVADVLQQAAGVHVIQYGGLGSFSTVSLRGSPANQVALYLDGTPLTSPAHGTVNLADLPATAVERIEVYRGAGPFGFGTGPGGAINVVTLSATTRAEVRSARGAWDTWEGRASLSGSRGPL
ncbi:MAG TPA: Plug domain-containing protein, partial [Candidatus Limnocylindria bacterium]|nr:Plug domain-containing protein [Candidatus Limnocylindria bacterium]